MQTGELETNVNQFQISNELTIREFFNGNIIRVSGQTAEGFPYITYSKVSNDKINTHGIIFIGGKFVDLNFDEKTTTIEPTEKNDDLAISIQYTQRAHSKQVVQIDVKIFDEQQNKRNDFHQNYGHISDMSVSISITDVEGTIVFSDEGITNKEGLFESQYTIPDNSKRETLTITINAENDESKSLEILQLFSLGNIPTDN